MSTDTLQSLSSEYASKTPEEIAQELKSLPFFMTEAPDGEENVHLEALRAMAYEGEPHEIAQNFRTRGNECFKQRKFQDAIDYYTQALDQHCGHADIDAAVLGNRSQAQLELRNYRKAAVDSASVLELDPANAKAWYRSARALFSVDKPEEAAMCIAQGLSVVKDGKQREALNDLCGKVEKRRKQLKELEAARTAREAAKLQRQRVLQLALSSRNFETRKSITSSEFPSDLGAELADPFDATSELSLPILALYPLTMESDILHTVSENTTIAEILAQLFNEPPQWATPDYTPSELVAFAPTSSGGLARAGAQASLAKIFGAPNVILLDGTARLYIVPKAKSKEWIQSWSKDAAFKQLAPENH